MKQQKEAMKENTVIHCGTEEEANRILGMAHELGYKWHTGENYENNTEWNCYKSTTCYYLFDGRFASYGYFEVRNYNIIPSTQIADLEPKKSSDWVPAPEDIEEIDEKASETQIGGNHYSIMKIQPIEYIMANKLSFPVGNVVKYVSRYDKKNNSINLQIQDLEKAKQNIDFIIEELRQ